MRKFLILLLILLLPTAAIAAEELTWNELLTWVDSCKERAISETTLNDPTDPQALMEDGYALIYDFATFYTDSPEMTEDTIIYEMVVTSGEEIALREMMLDIFSANVITTFRNDNEELEGTWDCAVLYLDEADTDSKVWGWVLRDGQRIQSVQYTVHEQLEDGFTDAGLLFTIDNDLVSAIRAYGLDERLTEAQLADWLDEVRAEQFETGYRAVATSLDGSTLKKFETEDLTFSGLDFLRATKADAVECFGTPRAENWTEDEENWLQELVFDGCTLTFLCDNEKQNPKLILFSTDEDGVEGPRSVRVGDTLASVLKRFRNGEGEYDEDGTHETLYGEYGTAPYGFAEYGEDASAVLRYAVSTESGDVALIITFTQMVADEVIVYLQ